MGKYRQLMIIYAHGAPCLACMSTSCYSDFKHFILVE